MSPLGHHFRRIMSRQLIRSDFLRAALGNTDIPLQSRSLEREFSRAACREVASHPNKDIGMYGIDSLRQLSSKFLDKEELANFQFQALGADAAAADFGTMRRTCRLSQGPWLGYTCDARRMTRGRRRYLSAVEPGADGGHGIAIAVRAVNFGHIRPLSIKFGRIAPAFWQNVISFSRRGGETLFRWPTEWRF